MRTPFAYQAEARHCGAVWLVHGTKLNHAEICRLTYSTAAKAPAAPCQTPSCAAGGCQRNGFHVMRVSCALHGVLHDPFMRPRGSVQCSRATPPRRDKLRARWLTASALRLSIDSQRARKKSVSLSTSKRNQALDMSQCHEDELQSTFSKPLRTSLCLAVGAVLQVLLETKS